MVGFAILSGMFSDGAMRHFGNGMGLAGLFLLVWVEMEMGRKSS